MLARRAIKSRPLYRRESGVAVENRRSASLFSRQLCAVRECAPRGPPSVHGVSVMYRKIRENSVALLYCFNSGPPLDTSETTKTLDVRGHGEGAQDH